MNKSFSNLLFSLAVTGVMNALDMTFHLSTGWAVHLNYVAVKFTVIFLSVWMITQFIGKGMEEGVVASIFGPFIFYVYYKFAGATLDRAVFKIDEQFWFFFLHAGLMLIAYFTAWNFVKSKNKRARTASFLVTAGFLAVALDTLLMMVRWRLQGVTEEDAAGMFTFSVISAPLISYLAAVLIGILTTKLTKSFFAEVLAAAVIASAAIGLFTKDVLHGIFAFVFVFLAYGIVNGCKKGIMSVS